MTTDRDDAFLTAHFDAARAAAPVPSEALIARVLADAEAVQSAPAAPGPRAARRWRDRFALLGGWPVLAGMATATVAGVWIGYAIPAPVSTVATGLGVIAPLDAAGGGLFGYDTLGGNEDWSGL